MNKLYYLLWFTALSPFLGFSQTGHETIQGFLNSNYSKWNLTQQDVSDWIIESEGNSKSTKIYNYYIVQRYQGIEIFHAVSNVWMKNNQVVNVTNRFIDNVNQKVNTISPSITVLEGLFKAKAALDIPNEESNTIINNPESHIYFISNGALQPIKAKLVYQKIKNTLRLAWDFKIPEANHNHYWSVRIDAVNGQLLDKKDWVVRCNFDHDAFQKNDKDFCFNFNDKILKPLAVDVPSGSYRVIPYNIESPNHGIRALISGPSDIVASPFGWHDTDGNVGNEYTITRGNNVYAYEDINDLDLPGLSPDGGANLVFDFPYPGNNFPASDYTNAATTNLFYMNNVVHDIFYHYGFDEQNGNFQVNNYGLGGSDNDFVIAEAQDGSRLNNANFLTPPDGESGYMQMYLWNRKPEENLIKVNSPSSISGDYSAIDNSFVDGHVDLPIHPLNLTANLVLYDDGEVNNAEACVPAINASSLNGNIAVIRRGTCTSIEKVLNAQDAGAIAVIVVNNLDNNLYISGSDDTITIPAICVNQSTGEFLINQMATNTVEVSLSMPPSGFINADGDFDNVVIAHEYGHGISTRLTGGRFNTDCLDNDEQMGEGWSDWFGLMLQMKPGDFDTQPKGIGTFVSNQPTDGGGIRRYPYSTDMTINPFTFADTNTAILPHGIGSVWATMLWDLSWAYINKYGFNSNIYTGNGGNNKVLQVIVDALKLQPCNPSFVEARDAIIAADQAITGGQDYCMIWEVFARRGLGYYASSGDGFSSVDQAEDFTVPDPGPNCTLGIDYFHDNELIKVYPNPSNGKITISISHFSGNIDIEVVDINGRIISSIKKIEFNLSEDIDLGGIQSGVYILRIKSDVINTSKKIILN